MNIHSDTFRKYSNRALTVIALSSMIRSDGIFCPRRRTPALTVAGNVSFVRITVAGADPDATILLHYPNTSAVVSTADSSYTWIDIGKTDSNGAFGISVSPSSYGLSGGNPYMSL